MYTESDEIMARANNGDVDPLTLHNRNKGMKSVRATENIRILLGDQVTAWGQEHIILPRKSPTLNTRKWNALKRRGWTIGFVGRMETVMGGKTA